MAGPLPSCLRSLWLPEVEELMRSAAFPPRTPPRYIFSRRHKAEGEECQDALAPQPLIRHTIPRRAAVQGMRDGGGAPRGLGTWKGSGPGGGQGAGRGRVGFKWKVLVAERPWCGQGVALFRWEVDGVTQSPRGMRDGLWRGGRGGGAYRIAAPPPSRDAVNFLPRLLPYISRALGF